jgi:hypothetical protein
MLFLVLDSYPSKKRENVTTDKTQIGLKEKMAELQAKFKSLHSQIVQAEQFLFAHPESNSTMNRYNILCHNKSEVMTKIRKLKEKIQP